MKRTHELTEAQGATHKSAELSASLDGMIEECTQILIELAGDSIETRFRKRYYGWSIDVEDFIRRYRGGRRMRVIRLQRSLSKALQRGLLTEEQVTRYLGIQEMERDSATK